MTLPPDFFPLYGLLAVPVEVGELLHLDQEIFEYRSVQTTASQQLLAGQPAGIL